MNNVNFVPPVLEDGEYTFSNYYDFSHDTMYSQVYFSIYSVSCLKLWGLFSTVMYGFSTPFQSAWLFDTTFQCMSSDKRARILLRLPCENMAPPFVGRGAFQLSGSYRVEVVGSLFETLLVIIRVMQFFLQHDWMWSCSGPVCTS